MRKLKNTKGFALLEALIAMGLIAAAALSQSNFTRTMLTNHNKQNKKVNLEHIRQEITSMLTSPTVIQKTILSAVNSASFDCLKNSTDCFGAKDFALVLSDDTTYYDTFNPASGFTSEARTCDSYDANGVGACNVRAHLSWRPACASSPCINPKRIWINFSLSSNSNDYTPISWSSYQMSLVHQPKDLGINDWFELWPTPPDLCSTPVAIVDTSMFPTATDGRYVELKKVDKYLFSGIQNSANENLSGLEIFDMNDITNPVSTGKFYTTNALSGEAWGATPMGITTSSDSNTTYIATYTGGVIRVDTSDKTNPLANGIVKVIAPWANGFNNTTRNDSVILDETTNTLYNLTERISGASGTIAYNPNGFPTGTNIQTNSVTDIMGINSPNLTNPYNPPLSHWAVNWPALIPGAAAFLPAIPNDPAYAAEFPRNSNPFRVVRILSNAAADVLQLSVAYDWYTGGKLGTLYAHRYDPITGSLTYLGRLKYRGFPGEIIGTYNSAGTPGYDDRIVISDLLNRKIQTFDFSNPANITLVNTVEMCPGPNCRTANALYKSFFPIPNRQSGELVQIGGNKYLISASKNTAGLPYPYPQYAIDFPDAYDGHNYLHINEYTNPANPKNISYVDLGTTGGYLRWIRAYGNYIYALTDPDPNPGPTFGKPILFIVNASNPASPVLANTIALSSGNAKNIKIHKNTLFVVYNSLTDPSDNHLVEFYDLAVPTNPVLYRQLTINEATSNIEADAADNVFVSLPGKIATFQCAGKIR